MPGVHLPSQRTLRDYSLGSQTLQMELDIGNPPCTHIVMLAMKDWMDVRPYHGLLCY